MSDRSDRGDALGRRLNKDESNEEPEDAQKSKQSKPPKPSKTEGEKKAVKDRPSVLMYLPDEVFDELDITFDELNARYKRKHGEALQKNRDYYPAVVRAGLEGKDIEDILEV